MWLSFWTFWSSFFRGRQTVGDFPPLSPGVVNGQIRLGGNRWVMFFWTFLPLPSPSPGRMRMTLERDRVTAASLRPRPKTLEWAEEEEQQNGRGG